LDAATLKLIGFVLPLGLDTFGVALALGIAGLPASRRTQLALLFAAFESAMPFVGLLLGSPLGRAIGSTADYLAAGLVAALGLYMLLVDQGEHQEGARLLSILDRGVAGALALGLSISLDELAIGFSAGLLRLPVVPMLIAIAAQAFILTRLGIGLGARIGEHWRELSERIAGIALVALGAALLATRAAA
jgi:putative Mn2+ efflux pump MntP